jgi:hypothetical protein
MIEIDSSRTGLPILKSGGKHLNSTYDPIREAQTWLVTILPQVASFDQIFVLGFGSAYHLMALLKSLPSKRIHVIERDPDLVRESTDLFFDLRDVKLSLFENASLIFTSPDILEICKKNLIVLRMPSTRFLNKEFFDEAQLTLTARRPQDFKKVCQQRTAFLKQLNLEQMDQLSTLSVQNFSWISNEDRMTPEYRNFKILKELIK